MHVLIIGGGIGGLALAQGLQRQGVSFEIHEREIAFGSRASGYRIDIEEMGARAMRNLLPTEAWEGFRATRSLDERFAMMTERLDVYVDVPASVRWRENEDIGGRYGIDRHVLRSTLLTGLGDHIRYGNAFERYETNNDGTVTAHFSDGTTATGDVLVGADGSTSRVGRQYLPNAGLISSGTICVAHKLPLTDEVLEWLPERLASDVALVLPLDSTSAFNAAFRPPADSGIQSYILLAVMWAPTGTHDNPVGAKIEAITALVDERTKNWHPALRRLIADAPIELRDAIEFKYSDRRESWAPTSVTLLGDALHSTPPSVGRGGNTALRDAHLLAIRLGAVHRGEEELITAIGAYEEELRINGYGVIDESIKMLKQVAAGGKLANWIGRVSLSIMNRLPKVRDNLFAGPAGVGVARDWELASRPLARFEVADPEDFTARVVGSSYTDGSSPNTAPHHRLHTLSDAADDTPN